MGLDRGLRQHQRLDDVVVQVEGGQDEDPHPRLEAGERTHGRDPVHTRHARIHEDDVGVAGASGREDPIAVLGLP